MTKEAAALVMGAAALAILLLMLFAWRRRARRDADLSAPLGVPEHAAIHQREEVLYVATTHRDEPLERLAIRPLAYRARGEVALSDRGIALCLDGAPTVFLSTDRLVQVDRSTWTIDRVVERDGLVRITWRAEEQHEVDSYLRLVTGDITEFIRSASALCTAPETGAKA